MPKLKCEQIDNLINPALMHISCELEPVTMDIVEKNTSHTVTWLLFVDSAAIIINIDSLFDYLEIHHSQGYTRQIRKENIFAKYLKAV